MNIFDLITAPAIAAYWTEDPSNKENYLGPVLFPPKKKKGLSLKFIKGYKGLPVALKPASFDTKAPVRDRIGFKEISTEMPFFRETMTIKEELRQQLLELGETNNSKYYETIIRDIFDDRKTLIQAALVQPERMIMQLLSSKGVIGISANGIDYDYDFDTDGSYATSNYVKMTGTDVWSDFDNADPVQDINDMSDAIYIKTGTKPSRGIMTLKTWRYLSKNKKIKEEIKPASIITNTSASISDKELKEYLIEKTGITFAIYNKKYRDEQGAQKDFYPDNFVTLIPDGTLGSTWFGTTPEEADLNSKKAPQGTEVEIVETGIAITTYQEVHPVNSVTVVSEIVLPSYERMDEVGVLEVA